MRLSDFLEYNDIAIQCHDNPDADALASGYGVYVYLKAHGKNVKFVYGGRFELQKSNLLLMINKLSIPIKYVKELDKPELLIMVDCQYDGGNVAHFDADTVAVIDHHQISGPLPELSDVRSNLGSCATLVYSLLMQEYFDVNADSKLATALYYGLLTDTNNFAELNHPMDRDLREEVEFEQSLITLFRNSNLSLKELGIAGEALMGYEYNDDYRYAIVKAKPCDPNILGMISDMTLEVDTVDSCLVYSELPFGVKFSVRSCVKEINAGELAEYIAAQIGSGGGHSDKAGGFIQGELLKKSPVDYLKTRLNKYFAETEVIYAESYVADVSDAKVYKKKNLTIGYVDPAEFLSVGSKVLIRALEGDMDVTIKDDFYIMIGIKGEVYPCSKEKFNRSNKPLDEAYNLKCEYEPVIKNNMTGEKIDLLPYAKSCISTGDVTIYAKQISGRIKVFTAWDKEKYMLGRPGDYMAVRMDDYHDIYVIAQDVFEQTYEPVSE